ncbi:MAG: T9SS type A sorting domain-containing protein [Ignavibacteriaceae bacterium]|nr:T9SS type A sorting domain-containing protein [Ignavibacteriaceae bacterium]
MAIFTNLVKQANVPEKFELSQNSPNPFKGKTSIKYSLPHKTKVIIMINDIHGQVLHKIVSPDQNAGTYEIEFYADGLPGGNYFYHIITDDFFKSREMELIK